MEIAYLQTREKRKNCLTNSLKPDSRAQNLSTHANYDVGIDEV